MVKKRTIFLLLSITTLISTPILIYKFGPTKSLWDIIPISILAYLLLFIVHLLSIALTAIKGDGYIFDHITFIFGVINIRLKRIYYSDLGYFYISIPNGSGELVDIYRQNYLYSKKLTSFFYKGDVNDLRNEIKSKLDSIYEVELKKKREKNLIKSWDGYIDIQSKRDDKLNQLLK